MARAAYNYGTSPRKLNDTNIRKKATKTKARAKARTKSKTITKGAEQRKQAFKSKRKVLLFTITLFSMLFAVSYRGSLINEQFSKAEKTKTQLQKIQKENEQIEIAIENNVNVNNIEKLAKERLGMQKLDKSQIVYVTLDKKDYVEPAVEPVVIKNEENIISKLTDGIFKFFGLI